MGSNRKPVLHTGSRDCKCVWFWLVPQPEDAALGSCGPRAAYSNVRNLPDPPRQWGRSPNLCPSNRFLVILLLFSVTLHWTGAGCENGQTWLRLPGLHVPLGNIKARCHKDRDGQGRGRSAPVSKRRGRTDQRGAAVNLGVSCSESVPQPGLTRALEGVRALPSFACVRP